MAEQSKSNLNTAGFVELKRRLDDSLSIEQRTLDKLIITISSGVIIVSFTSIPQLFAHNIFVKMLIVVIWSAFVACIITSVYSYNLCIKAYRHEIEGLDKLYRGEINREQYVERINRNVARVRNANRTTNILFVAGMLLLLLFGSVSLFTKENKMSDTENNSRPERPEKGPLTNPSDHGALQKSSVEPTNIITPEIDIIVGPQNLPDSTPSDTPNSQPTESPSESGVGPDPSVDE